METKDIGTPKPLMKGNNNKGKPKKIFEFRVNFNFKNIILWILILLIGLSFLNPFLAPSNIDKNKPLTEILNDIKEKKVKKVEVEEEKITAFYKDNKVYSSRKETDNSFIDILKASGIDPKSVEVTVKEAIFGNIWLILGNVLPLLLMVGFFIFIFRQARGAQDSLFSFGASKAKLFDKGKQKITFADVAGVDEAKKELEEIVDFLKHPLKYRALGARTPKGVLLVGPSGTGKTLLAKAIAGEANVPFFSMAGSEFMEMLVGVGASVTGDTPILIKEKNKIKLVNIGDFIDRYYSEGESEIIKKVKGLKTLGFETRPTKVLDANGNNRFVFDKSTWQGVNAVYRHKAEEIYKIEYLDGGIWTTGDHSVFVLSNGAIFPNRVDQLKPGDLLVNLPLNIKNWIDETEKTYHQIKGAAVKKITKLAFKGYVYDLCGIQNEAFFGGEKPILLHNSRVRDLFSTAKKAAPSIIFIDEIESIGRTRSMIGMSSHDEREQTLNQILVEMDGFTPNENLIIVGASNRPDLLDPALVRPGRFDRRVALDLPDIEGRKAILKIHMRGKPFDLAVDWDKMAKRTVGFSGADLENMLNEAAILAARLSKKAIDMSDLEEAATKVKLGPEKKRLQSDLDRKMTAYHEAGHGVATFLLPTMDPVHRISIVSRGLALGYTLIPPAKDRYNETRSRLVEQISSLLGGRAAEEVEFKEFTAGASSDIKTATEVARDMVISLGMSDLGPINFGPQTETTEYGKFFSESNQISPEMQAKIDGEVKKIIDKAYEITLDLLKKNKKKLDLVAEVLVKKETIEGDEFKVLMEGK